MTTGMMPRMMRSGLMTPMALMPMDDLAARGERQKETGGKESKTNKKNDKENRMRCVAVDWPFGTPQIAATRALAISNSQSFQRLHSASVRSRQLTAARSKLTTGKKKEQRTAGSATGFTRRPPVPTPTAPPTNRCRRRSRGSQARPQRRLRGSRTAVRRTGNQGWPFLFVILLWWW